MNQGEPYFECIYKSYRCVWVIHIPWISMSYLNVSQRTYIFNIYIVHIEPSIFLPLSVTICFFQVTKCLVHLSYFLWSRGAFKTNTWLARYPPLDWSILNETLSIALLVKMSWNVYMKNSCCLSVLTLILGASHNTNLYNNFEFLPQKTTFITLVLRNDSRC